MRARAHDARDGLLRRGAILLAAPLYLGWMILHEPSDFRWPYETLCAAGALALLGPLFARRSSPRAVGVRIGNGHIDLAGAGLGRLVPRRVHASDVTAIHAAPAAEGASLVIARGSGSLLFLELAGERDAEAIAATLDPRAQARRLALPARAGGLPGDTGFPRGVSWRDALELLARACGLAAWLAFFILTERHEGREALFGAAAVGSVVVATLLRLLRPFFRARLEIRGDELHLGKRLGAACRRIAGARVTRSGLALTLAGDDGAATTSLAFGLPGRTPAERAHVAAHLLAEARRAGAPAIEAPARAEALGTLRRGEGESARAWLGRLDDLGKSRDADPYRRTPLDRPELWALVEDASAPLDLRAAAARVLVRIEPPEARRRIAALSKAAGADTRRRLRIALDDDPDHAGEAYEALPPPFRALPEARPTPRGVPDSDHRAPENGQTSGEAGG